MSPMILTTDPDSPYDVELAGVGVLGGNARGGITAERAALVCTELQDDDGEPLSGSQLTTAAKRFADDRGLSTRNVPKITPDVEEQLRVEGGAVPRGRSIEEISAEYAARDRVAINPPDSAAATPADVAPPDLGEPDENTPAAWAAAAAAEAKPAAPAAVEDTPTSTSQED